MSAFKADEQNDDSLDWIILRDGSIALYKRNEFLEEDLQWLQAKGYLVISFDCTGWHSDRQMHNSLKDALSFPSYYGRNLDALNECMADDLIVPDDGGLAIVLRRYDSFFNGFGAAHGAEKGEAEIVLSIFASASRCHMLSGRRLITLVQSDDPAIQFGRLGCVGAIWNWRERLNSSRGL